jgi:hypothetical protein
VGKPGASQEARTHHRGAQTIDQKAGAAGAAARLNSSSRKHVCAAEVFLGWRVNGPYASNDPSQQFASQSAVDGLQRPRSEMMLDNRPRFLQGRL